MLTERIDVVSLIEYDDCIFEIKGASLEETPIQQIVEGENSQLRLLGKLFGVKIRTDQLLPPKLLEFL